LAALSVSFALMILAAWTATLPAALVGRLIDDIGTRALDSFARATPILSRAAATFIVAHRLSTPSITNKIIVVNEGSVVQEGTFETLSRSHGLFRDLLVRQDVRPRRAEGGERSVGSGGKCTSA
jgi:hypothetical protein